MIPNLFYMRTPDYAAFKEKRYQWRSQPKILGAAKYLTLGEQQYFCFGRRFSKHKMARYAKNLTMSPFGCAYEGYVMVI